MSNLPSTATNVWKTATEAEIAQALASLSSLPSRATGDETIDRGSYYVALDGVTRHGLAKAVTAILQGALGHAFFPSPPELRMQCDAAMKPHEEARQRQLRQERIRRERLPDRREPTPDEKARVAKLMQQFRASHDDAKHDEIEADRAMIRQRYGMTEEALAAVPERSLGEWKPISEQQKRQA